jgi:uncharacterized membrane protein YedE/YeeE
MWPGIWCWPGCVRYDRYRQSIGFSGSVRYLDTGSGLCHGRRRLRHPGGLPIYSQDEKTPALPFFSLPGKSSLDGRLLTGAAIFGIGWGIYGYCPGPALSALLYLDSKTLIFVVAMLIGMALANKVGRA